jgi:hypothetical protein
MVPTALLSEGASRQLPPPDVMHGMQSEPIADKAPQERGTWPQTKASEAAIAIQALSEMPT